MDCPHPAKQRHASKAAAVASIRSRYKAGKGNPDLTAYLCVCGAWHVGHSVKLFGKRIKRAVDAGNRTSRRTRKQRKR